MLRGLLRLVRSKVGAREGWCRQCRRRPAETGSRYCSSQCAEADAEEQAFGM